MTQKTSQKKNKNNTKKEFLTIGKLSELLGVRYGTIKFYSEIGILPFEQEGKRLRRYFQKEKVLKRLKEIKKLKEKGLRISEIINYFKKEKINE